MLLIEEASFRLVWFQNSRGSNLAGLLSWPAVGDVRALVVIPPAFEKEIRHYSILSRYLIRAGFATFRFDFSNHVGVSDGEILDLTLSSMTDDITSALRVRHPETESSPLALAAPSLSALCAVRSVPLAERDCAAVALLLPVVECRYTFEQTSGLDVVGLWHEGELDDPDQPLVFVERPIRLACVQDAIHGAFDRVDVTRAYIERIGAPLTAIVAQEDDWVRTDDVAEALSAPTEHLRRLVVLEGSSHDVAHNSPVMRSMLEHCVAALTSPEATHVDKAGVAPIHFEFEEFVDTIRTEKEWARSGYDLPQTSRSELLI